MTLEFDPIEEAATNWRAAGWGAIDAMTAATSITRAHQILVGRIDAALAPPPPRHHPVAGPLFARRERR